MLTLEQASKKLDIKERTLSKAIKEHRVRYERDDVGAILLPDDAITPLSKASIQSFLWVVLSYKNDPNSKPDVSCVKGVNKATLNSAFKQLVFRGFIDQIDGSEDLTVCFNQCRVTQKGMSLVQGKRLPGSHFSNALLEAGFEVLFGELIKHIPEWF